ncbi:squamous cell carcinoma antigen recognized by T-cells 3 isoform X2 [Rhodamnia argentea]|uniref:Squamous cell carcinoma antigen recognized by T-cells 3 isoform X2 n=1 Tax=Rhodamnia argentea TaxID=178133 RepID=A0ABM3GV90_9MYRT|nr:squamous cell carcinoma antigen recognized by T-cells 3 isoform X2 [Rhodamnia argentea]
MADEAQDPAMPSPPNEPPLDVPADSSPPDSDSDSDSDSEAQDKLQIEALESELYSNPSNYDAHLQYIRLVRKTGDLNKLRQARDAMSALFPLTPVMWQEWARDEASLMVETDGYAVIEKLYDRGVSDYLSVPLWYDYIKFVQENDPSVCECSPVGVSKARNLFERALTAAGLHVTEGKKIWEAYREFEQAIYQTIDASDDATKDKQVQRIRNIFHRQLSIPLVDMESTLGAYKAWEAEQGTSQDVESCDVGKSFPHVATAYEKALDMYNARVNFEQQISRQDLSDTERLQQYMIYLKFEHSVGDPARIQVLYERAITDFPISSDLWLDYTRYMDKTLKAGDVVKDVHSRATKNCPWLGELWARYLLCLERGHSSESEICSVFEKSLHCTFSTFEEYLDLFLARVDGLRRRISFAGGLEVSSDYQHIRETFQRASDYLAPHLKNTDGLVRLYAYWARLESKLAKDIVSARGVWESLLKISGSMLEAWQSYIAMEIELGHIREARSIYKRCYSKRFPGPGSEEVCNSWLRFEREYGTLEDFDHALQKVMPRLEELQLFTLQQESRTADQKDINIRKNDREKRKSGADITDEESPAKRRKDALQITKKSYMKDKGQVQNAAELRKSGDKKTKIGDGMDQEEIKGSASDTKSKAYTDQCTAFISNLDLKANNHHIREFFSDVSGVGEIRILRDKFTGKSRGLAYVDFIDDAHLAAAVAKNKLMLLGKKLSIARSDPRKGRKESMGHSDHAESGKSTSRGSTASQKSNYSTSKERVEQVQLTGKNTFARPRSLKPLGWDANKPRTNEAEDEKPKSNDEFRQLFLKK